MGNIKEPGAYESGVFHLTKRRIEFVTMTQRWIELTSHAYPASFFLEKVFYILLLSRLSRTGAHVDVLYKLKGNNSPSPSIRTRKICSWLGLALALKTRTLTFKYPPPSLILHRARKFDPPRIFYKSITSSSNHSCATTASKLFLDIISIFAPAPAPTGVGGFTVGCGGIAAVTSLVSAVIGILYGVRSGGAQQDLVSNIEGMKAIPCAQFFALETDEFKSYVDSIGDFAPVTVKYNADPPPASSSPPAFAALLSGLFSLLSGFPTAISSSASLLASLAFDFAFNLLVWQTISWGFVFLFNSCTWLHQFIAIFRAIPTLDALLKSLPSEREARKDEFALVTRIIQEYATFIEASFNGLLVGFEGLAADIGGIHELRSDFVAIKQAMAFQQRSLGSVIASLIESGQYRSDLVKNLRTYATHNQEAMNAFQRIIVSLPMNDVEGHLVAVMVAVQTELKHTSLTFAKTCEAKEYHPPNGLHYPENPLAGSVHFILRDDE